MPAVKLSILIPSITKRDPLRKKIIKSLEKQRAKHKLEDIVEILYLTDDGQDAVDYQSIGAKCNQLVEQAKGKYVAFIGDDDRPSNNYIADIIAKLPDGAKKNPDCITFKCKKTTNGEKPVIQYFGIENKHYVNMQKGELRPPGMITPIKRSIASQIKFEERIKEKDRGIGQTWATALVNSQLIKTSVHINKILYYFKYNTKK